MWTGAPFPWPCAPVASPSVPQTSSPLPQLPRMLCASPTPPEVVPHELLSHSQGSGCHPALPGVVPVFSAAATSPVFWISALNPSFAVFTASPEHQPAAPRTSSQCNPSLYMALHPSASPLHPPHIVLHPSSALLHLAPEVPHSVWGDRAQLCPDNEICFSAGLLPQWLCCEESCR